MSAESIRDEIRAEARAGLNDLEPGAFQAPFEVGGPKADRIQRLCLISLAISAKRIADALEAAMPMGNDAERHLNVNAQVRQ